jgi:toxin-antitoxin system PIN domain toxin
VIAVDTNILVHAHRRDSTFHAQAADRVRSLAEGTGPWAIPWPCIHEFLAIVTDNRLFRPPTPIGHAISQVGAWLESPSLVMLAEPNDYWKTLSRNLMATKPTGGAILDARIASLCAVHGVKELWTVDRDFSRFVSLRCVNPLLRV